MSDIGKRLHTIFGDRNGLLVRGEPSLWAISSQSHIQPGQMIDISIDTTGAGTIFTFGCRISNIHAMSAKNITMDTVRKNIFGQIPVSFGPLPQQDIHPDDPVTFIELDLDTAQYVFPNTQPFVAGPDGHMQPLRPI